MNEQIKEEWALNLENGDLKQITGALHVGGGFCCLGVLCEMAKIAGVVGAQKVRLSSLLGRTTYYSTEDSTDNCSVVLPQCVQQWAGLTNNDPIIKEIHLSTLNDTGTKFPEIAKLIRKHL